MVSDVVEPAKPERRKLVQHRALVRNGIGQNYIERRNAVGDDEEQCIPEIENLAHFAAAKSFDSGKINRGKRWTFE